MIYTAKEELTEWRKSLEKKVKIDEEGRLLLDTGRYEWWRPLDDLQTPEQLLGLCTHIAQKKWGDQEMIWLMIEKVSEYKKWKIHPF